jgi:hypothetical protein
VSVAYINRFKSLNKFRESRTVECIEVTKLYLLLCEASLSSPTCRFAPRKGSSRCASALPEIKETPVTYEKKQVGKIKDVELDVEAGLVYADFELDEQTKKAILERD